MIYTVKTVVGRENIVLDSIASKVKTEGLQITALLHPEEIKGYVFVEGDVKDIEKALQMVPHIRGQVHFTLMQCEAIKLLVFCLSTKL